LQGAGDLPSLRQLDEAGIEANRDDDDALGGRLAVRPRRAFPLDFLLGRLDELGQLGNELIHPSAQVVTQLPVRLAQLQFALFPFDQLGIGLETVETCSAGDPMEGA
jgi:hypothetical protein